MRGSVREVGFGLVTPMEFDAEPQPVQVIQKRPIASKCGQPQSIVQYVTRFALLVIVALAVGVATAMDRPATSRAGH